MSGRPRSAAARLDRTIEAMTQTEEHPNPYRALPAIDRLLADAQVAPLAARHGHAALLQIAREVLDEYRAEIERGGEPPARPAAEAIVARAEALEPTLRRVVNATGVVIHTNLGRAPLSRAAIAAMAAASEGYSNLEFDLAGGTPHYNPATGALAATISSGRLDHDHQMETGQ